MTSSNAFGGSGQDQLDPFDAGDANIWRKAEYLGRYLFAADFLMLHLPRAANGNSQIADQRVADKRTIADISCGMGYGTDVLGDIAESVVGVDSSRDMIEKAIERCNIRRPGARFLRKDLDSEDLFPDIEENTVDAVVSFETLEHLVDPNRAASQFSRILKKNGFLICSVPNVLSESGDGCGLPRNKGHKQWFSFASLCRMLQACGFQVIYRLGQSKSRALFRREQQMIHAKRILHKICEEPIMHTPEMIRWLAYVAAYPTVEDADGSYSLIVVAQKK